MHKIQIAAILENKQMFSYNLLKICSNSFLKIDFFEIEHKFEC